MDNKSETGENMSTESESKRNVKVIDTFSADPRSQNWYGKPVTSGESLDKPDKQGVMNAWAVGGLAALAITALAAVGIKTGNDRQSAQPETAPNIPGVELADQSGPKRYTGEITVKISPELNIRTAPQRTEQYGGRKPNIIEREAIKEINGMSIQGLLGFRVKDGLVFQGNDVEGSKNWLGGLEIKTNNGEIIEGFISLSNPTMRTGIVQMDNFGQMVPAVVQNGQILDSSKFEPIRAGAQR